MKQKEPDEQKSNSASIAYNKNNSNKNKMIENKSNKNNSKQEQKL